MNFMVHCCTAWKIARKYNISTGAWMLYTALFMDSVGHNDCAASFNLGIADAGRLIGVYNLQSIRKYKKELIDAGLLEEIQPGSSGRGNTGVYRLVTFGS